MRFSRKSDYALRALTYLAIADQPGPISIRTLSQKNDIPYRFLQQIVLDLKANGWINTIAGREGGIHLAKRPENITVGEVVRHFDGVLAPIGCVSIKHYELCSQESVCLFRSLLLEVRNNTAALLDRTSLADLTRSPVFQRPAPMELFFDDGAGI